MTRKKIRTSTNANKKLITHARAAEDILTSNLTQEQKKIFQEAVNKISHSRILTQKGKIKRITAIRKYLESVEKGEKWLEIEKGLFKKTTHSIKTPKELLKKVKQEEY